MVMLSIIQAAFLVVVVFAFHSTNFNKRMIEEPVMAGSKYAWPRVFLAYFSLFLGAIFVWKSTLGRLE